MILYQKDCEYHQNTCGSVPSSWDTWKQEKSNYGNDVKS